MIDLDKFAEYIPFFGAVISGGRVVAEDKKNTLPPALVARVLELSFAGAAMYAAYSSDMTEVRMSIESLRGSVIEVRAVADKVLVLSQKTEATAIETTRLNDEINVLKKDLYKVKFKDENP